MDSRFPLLTLDNIEKYTDQVGFVYITTLRKTVFALDCILEKTKGQLQTPPFTVELLFTIDSRLDTITHDNTFAKCKTQEFLRDEHNDFWNLPIGPGRCSWTPHARAQGVPVLWLNQLMHVLEVDLSEVHEEITRIHTLQQPRPPAGTIPPPDSAQQPMQALQRYDPQRQVLDGVPNSGTHLGHLADILGSAAADGPALRAGPAVVLPEQAKPLSSFILGAKSAAHSQGVQVTQSEDGTLLFTTQRARAQPVTISAFFNASKRMQATVYRGLGLEVFHDNILANSYFDKYTMDSILTYEFLVRQEIHDAPPGTLFRAVYMELAALHLVKLSDANVKLLTSAASQQLQQQRQQRSSPGFIDSSSNSFRSSGAARNFGGSFPACQTFAMGECTFTGGPCSRSHACATCGKAYPAQRSCPMGHKYEEVCSGITEKINEREAGKRARGGAAERGAGGGAGKRFRSNN